MFWERLFYTGDLRLITPVPDFTLLIHTCILSIFLRESRKKLCLIKHLSLYHKMASLLTCNVIKI